MGLEASSQGLAFSGAAGCRGKLQSGFLLLEIAAKLVTVAVSWLRKVNATSGTFTQACVAGAVLKHRRELLKHQINLQTSTGCKLLGTDGLAGELLGQTGLSGQTVHGLAAACS
jgi:hypothetical protein